MDRKNLVIAALLLTCMSPVANAAQEDKETGERAVGHLTDISIVPTAFNEMEKSLVHTDQGIFVVRGLLSGEFTDEVRIHHHRHDSFNNHFEYNVLCIHHKNGHTSDCGEIQQ